MVSEKTARSAVRGLLFHGFSDRSRLAIVEALLEGERRVSDLVAVTGLNQPNASMHLACLFDCGLVDRERRGRERRGRERDCERDRSGNEGKSMSHGVEDSTLFR